MQRIRVLWISICLVLLVSVAGGTIFGTARLEAHAAGATIALSAAVGPPTSSLIVSGSGYGPTQNVLLKVDTVVVGKTQTDTTGAFSASITIPTSALPGHHTIFAASTLPPNFSAHAGFLVQAEWPMYGYDSQHTNTNPYENVLSPATVSSLVLAWKYCVPSATCYPRQSEAFIGGVFADGLLYVNSTGPVSRVWALHPTNGGRVWAAGYVHHRTVSIPAVANGIIYFSDSGTRSLLALNARTGAMLWSYHGLFDSAPIVANGIVYQISYEGYLFAFNAATGALDWRLHSKSGFGELTVSDGLVYVGSGNDLYALDALTGTTVWKLPGIGATMELNGTVYGSSTTGLVALDEQTGALLWQAPMNGLIIAAADGVIYVTANGSLYALDAITGATLWSYVLTCSVSVLANGVFYGSTASDLCALNATTGAMLWSYPGVTNVQLVANGVLYAVTTDYIYAFHLP